MAIQEVTMYAAVCDNCNKGWFNDYHGWSAMHDESSLKEMISNDDWHLEYGKTYCPDCFEIDEEDNILIKSSNEESEVNNG